MRSKPMHRLNQSRASAQATAPADVRQEAPANAALDTAKAETPGKGHARTAFSSPPTLNPGPRVLSTSALAHAVNKSVEEVRLDHSDSVINLFMPSWQTVESCYR